MLLSEYRSKEILRQYGVEVPPARLARTPDEAEAACAGLNARKYVVKAQITAGGRGLAGGVRFAATPSTVRDEAARMLGSRLVTAQTDARGEVVEEISVEAAFDLRRQVFLAIALDPESGHPMLLASSEGGVTFEERVRMDAGAVSTFLLTDAVAEDPAALAVFLGGIGAAGPLPAATVLSMRQAFIDNDMTLLEVNPFAELPDGRWLAIDAKIVIDANALFRHPEFEGLAAGQRLSPTETEAQRANINFVPLEGDIGVVVNGAGLGLATNDMLVEAKGKPANFMDIRTTATSFDIARGVELLLAQGQVRAILLNVHGGGMTVCDTVAEGVAFAYARAARKVPVAVCLGGQNAEWGLKILQDRKVPVTVYPDMKAAAQGAVALASGGAR
ncbi:MAG TPA: acetate--CoA ligase family protein [Paracoccaceae bacterium]|nr:acetate--CoA ligase family protein [Paracoccaceae bacterium]HMO72773.1 acetate--CoA ligase family protein [Paracoccaceae bacterium]